MLRTSKSITLSGQSFINGTQVSNFSASVNSESGSSNINSSVINQDLYDANKKEVRQDLADFTTKVYDVEDQLDSEASTDGTDDSVKAE